jgi:hypothetical protein
LTEGVTQSRIETHRLRLMVDRALALVDTSVAREHLWQVGGDLIQGFPERLSELERSLDRTSYALVVMGEDFLRGRIPADDRYVVDEATKAHPYAGPRQKDSMAARVAGRYMTAYKGAAPSAEYWFFDNPEKRETRQFAETGALSNLPPTAAKAVKEFESPDRTVGEAKQEAKAAPPPPSKIETKPGGKEFSTLNRFVVETEQPKAGRVPQGRDDIPKAKKIVG